MNSLLQQESFFQLVSTELQELEQVVLGELEHYDPTLVAAAVHLMKAGGKRLRPVMVLLAGRAVGLQAAGQAHHYLAMAVEILHTATLIHDDIIDGSSLRRGLPTVNQQWGLRTSVLTGDFLLARSCYYISLIEKIRLNTIFSQMVMEMCNGEMSQLERRYRASISYEQYLEQVRCKTALLMAVGCQGAAIISEAETAQEEALYTYGHELGIAFQIMDDMLDFTVSENEMGKSACNDLVQGQITLPTWYALQESPAADELRTLIERRFETEGDLERGLAIVRESPGLKRCESDAQRHVQLAIAALQVLPESPARAAMADLAEFSIQRRH
ncbi:MAG: polyprenyl synthetase family protein [Candidatus Sericytochromatia bacterium]